jgi:hypothetical protein
MGLGGLWRHRIGHIAPLAGCLPDPRPIPTQSRPSPLVAPTFFFSVTPCIDFSECAASCMPRALLLAPPCSLIGHGVHLFAPPPSKINGSRLPLVRVAVRRSSWSHQTVHRIKIAVRPLLWLRVDVAVIGGLGRAGRRGGWRS